MSDARYAWKLVDLWQCSECGAMAMSHNDECPNCGIEDRMLYAGEMPDSEYTGYVPNADCPICGNLCEPVMIAGSAGRHRCTACGFEGVRTTDDIPF